jgi:hypothetical protein
MERTLKPVAVGRRLRLAEVVRIAWEEVEVVRGLQREAEAEQQTPGVEVVELRTSPRTHKWFSLSGG